MNEVRKLVIAIDDQSITFAWVEAANQLMLQRSWPVASFVTLTDALLRFQQEAGLPLLDAQCAIGILGATEGETIMLSRGKWAISRSSLRGLLGSDPLVINDVAARAWAVCGGIGIQKQLLTNNLVPKTYDRPGCWTLTKIDAGVGLAVITVDDSGAPNVRACEMGHCGFAPVNAEDRALATALATTHNRLISWEMVLTLGVDDPVWTSPGLPMSRVSRMDMLARLAGRYVGDTVLAHGAWAGAVLTGKRASELVGGANQRGFNEAFEHKPKFAKLIRSTPRVLVGGSDMTLHGCVAALDNRPK